LQEPSSKNPLFYFFDDCLSAVDTETEETILNNLFEIVKTKLLIVSHRYRLLKMLINYYHRKRSNNKGSHNQLINEEGYYPLYLKQLSEKEML
jgi:ATP-binding cassette subfamily B protein